MSCALCVAASSITWLLFLRMVAVCPELREIVLSPTGLPFLQPKDLGPDASRPSKALNSLKAFSLAKWRYWIFILPWLPTIGYCCQGFFLEIILGVLRKLGWWEA